MTTVDEFSVGARDERRRALIGLQFGEAEADRASFVAARQSARDHAEALTRAGQRHGRHRALALGREPAEPGLMAQPPRPRTKGILTKAMLIRAWLWLGLLEAALVVGGFLFVLLSAGWSPGDATGEGAPLHHAYLMATTMTFAGITACQVGTAFASRTNRASLREVGVLSNPLLLWGIAFELLFAAALIYVPFMQGIFHTAALGLSEIALLASFPVIVWGSDELRRAWLRRHDRTPAPA